eukprot:4861672-Pyramimonas_sp.AAC.1
MSCQVEPAVIANTKDLLHMCIRNVRGVLGGVLERALGGKPLGKEETTAGIKDPLAAMQGLKYFERA